MTSSRPYLIRAIYEWIADNDNTVHILASTKYPGVEVPEGFDRDGQIVLNISMAVTKHLVMDNNRISFTASFKGANHSVYLPVGAILGIYSKETGQGMMFDSASHQGVVVTVENPLPEERKRPRLRVIK